MTSTSTFTICRLHLGTHMIERQFKLPPGEHTRRFGPTENATYVICEVGPVGQHVRHGNVMQGSAGGDIETHFTVTVEGSGAPYDVIVSIEELDACIDDLKQLADDHD